ncbi:MAG: RMD1 family protein [Candidatus Margulisiibacteriota bacterium]
MRHFFYASHFADQLDLKAIKTVFEGWTLVSSSSVDQFWSRGESDCCLIKQFGCVVFSGVSESDRRELLRNMGTFGRSFLTEPHEETFELLVVPDAEISISNKEIVVPACTQQVLRVVMFNLAQSVALDYYLQTAEASLGEVRVLVDSLEKKGRLVVRKKALFKTVGKALNIKSKIIENLYIFDSPDLVWEDSYLEAIHKKLAQFFDLTMRYREIDQTLRVVQDDLDVITQIYQHHESSLLEIIIILLILIELLNVFLH